MTASPESESATLTYHTPIPQASAASEASTKVDDVPAAKALEIPVAQVPAARTPVVKETGTAPPAPPTEPVSAAASDAKPPMPPSAFAKKETPKPLPYLKLSLIGAAAVIVVLVGAIVFSLRKHRAPEAIATPQPVAAVPTPAPTASLPASSAPAPVSTSFKLSSDTAAAKESSIMNHPPNFRMGNGRPTVYRPAKTN